MDKLTGPLLKPGPVDLHLALRSHLGHCYCFGEPAETTNSDSHNTHTICPLVASGLLLSVDSLHHKSKRSWPWCLMLLAGRSDVNFATQTSQEGHIVCASEWSSWISGWYCSIREISAHPQGAFRHQFKPPNFTQVGWISPPTGILRLCAHVQALSLTRLADQRPQVVQQFPVLAFRKGILMFNFKTTPATITGDDEYLAKRHVTRATILWRPCLQSNGWENGSPKGGTCRGSKAIWVGLTVIPISKQQPTRTMDATPWLKHYKGRPFMESSQDACGGGWLHYFW